jgi:Circadian oscillating protein COP23
MKNILLSALSITGLVVANIATTPTSAFSQDRPSSDPVGERRFYCGQAQDPTSKRILPATLMETQGQNESQTIVIWKSEYFSNFTPQKRCEIVSPKFQAAYQDGRGYLGSGTDAKTRQGIVCKVANENDPCTESNMLFTLKSYQDANRVIEDLSLSASGQSGIPVTQSGRGLRLKLSDLRRK